MTTVERAAKVIEAPPPLGSGTWYRPDGRRIAQALADAELLLSDFDRAVLDAADKWLIADQAGEPELFAERLAIAVSARRRTQVQRDFDRAVIDAADAWFDSYGFELDGSDDSPDAQIDARLYAAVRARREAQTSKVAS